MFIRKIIKRLIQKNSLLTLSLDSKQNRAKSNGEQSKNRRKQSKVGLATVQFSLTHCFDRNRVNAVVEIQGTILKC